METPVGKAAYEFCKNLNQISPALLMRKFRLNWQKASELCNAIIEKKKKESLNTK
jgi:hypothetical protein